VYFFEGYFMPTQLIRKQFLLTKEENQHLESEANKQGLSVSNLTRTRHGLEPLGAGGKREKTGRPPKAKKGQ
jgi:hypothetical protein